MTIKGAIFDVDGTLLDSMPVWDHIGEDFLHARGKSPKADMEGKLKVMSLLQCAEYMREEYALEESEEEIIKAINEMVERQYRDVIPEKPKVRKVLENFSKQNIPMCIATASERYIVEAALKRLNLLHYFDFILTCPETGKGKDEPDIYCMAAEILGTPKEKTAVFEDALHAARTAHKAGFPVVVIEDESAGEDSCELKRLADVYLQNYDQWVEKEV